MTYHAQRLLVAASRGARMIYTDGLFEGKEASTLYGFAYCDDYYIIHPDDAHLQYGPIATELRKMALDPMYTNFDSVRGMAITWADIVRFTTTDEASWVYLFAAELAADEGM